MVACCISRNNGAVGAAADNQTGKDVCCWIRGIVNAGYYNVVTGGSVIISDVSGGTN
ncbi:hypothetical protein FACS1894139_03480 [Planctomycetales bacterium]|nr:hypothetical protein FACS1894107_11200 [Planctomycetales bacterium]GHT00516.1 hypothetical protein FACS1894108_12750 [Planctomycetales bacterium]GHT03365.1 hypothetical protein FACS1894139_03480 [Planctomycetales bacterium]